MAIEAKAELIKETRVLEYWRKRYLAQGAAVGAVCAGAGAVGIYFLGLTLGGLFIFLLATLILEIMLKELRADLQVRGEGLIFAKKEALFRGLRFEEGDGIGENELLSVAGVPAYRVRERGSVMAGEGFVFEEEFLYTPVSSKFFELKQANFIGVLARFEAKGASEGDGKLKLKGGKGVVFSGALKEDVAAACSAVLALFGANEALFCVKGGMFYLLIKNERKLFFPFKLFEANALKAFSLRIEAVREAAEKVLSALNG